MNTKIKNILGQRFGRLVALDYKGKNGHRAAMWLCRCDCEQQKVLSGSALYRGDTRSCGCIKRELDHKKSISLITRNTGKHITEPGKSAFKHLYSHYKARAKFAGLDFDISCDDFKQLVVQNCYICDKAPSNCARCNKFKSNMDLDEFVNFLKIDHLGIKG